MKIFVISLASSVDRRKNIISQMAEQFLSFEFLDAINGQTEQHPILNAYCNKRRVSRKGYSLKPGELGCFASHYLLWEKCLILNEPIVILEDDVLLKKALSETLFYVRKHIHQLGLIRLSRTLLDPSFITLSYFSDTAKMVKYTKPAKGGMGYVLSPDAAKKLINSTENWHDPADDFLEKEWLHRVTVFGIEPPCLTHDHLLESEIGDRKKITQPITKRIKREIYRSTEWLLNQTVQLPLIIKIKLGLFKLGKNI